MAKNTSFKDMNADELAKMLGTKREELRGIRFASAGARPKDASAASKTRKDIARILTAMTANKNA